MATGSVQTPERIRNPRARSSESDTAASQNETVLLKSFLHKKGKRFKGWHQRYFEIQGTHMYYYKNPNKTDCLGEIDLSLCISCGPTNEATFGSPFEIKTTLRTHVMSARSPDEREQWIEIICKQSKASTSAKTKKEAPKPKRWKTFRSAFGGKTQRRHQKSQDNLLDPEPTTPNRRGRTIFGRFKRKTRRATLREVRTESSLHNNRPLSLLEDSTTMENLEHLLDAKPCHSLPATPLTRRRSNPMLFSRAEDMSVIDPMMTLPANLPSHSITAPSAYSDKENADNLPVITLMPPPGADRNRSPSDTSIDELTVNGEVTSMDITLEAPTSPASMDTLGDSPTSIEPKENEQLSDSTELKTVVINDTPASTNEEELASGGTIFTVTASFTDERKPYVIKDEAWEEIRTVLSKETNENGKSKVSASSYDVLPKQEQPWKNMSGVEGLRVFLEMVG